MTGTAVNVSPGPIYAGQPIGEDALGNAVAADATHPPFAICTNGGASGQVVSYTTDGVVEMNDWTRGLGTKTLIPGQIYRSANGQQIGTASSRTKLRIAIASSDLNARAQLLSVVGAPANTVGRVGDFAFDSSTPAFYGPKTASGWGAPAYLTSFQTTFQPITSS
jgi:hypothetical protein